MNRKIIGFALMLPAFLFIAQQFIKAAFIHLGSYEILGFSFLALALFGLKITEGK